MSGLEPLAVITVIVPALKATADLVNKARKKRKLYNKNLQWYQDEMAETLRKGEWEISTAYLTHIEQLGDSFRKGDEISNSRIQAQVAEAQTMKRVLELAMEYEPNRVDPIKDQFRVAASIPREVTRAMEELSIRVRSGAAVPKVIAAPSEASQYQTSFSRTSTAVETISSSDPGPSQDQRKSYPIRSASYGIPPAIESSPVSPHTSSNFQGDSPIQRQSSFTRREKSPKVSKPEERNSIASVKTTSSANSQSSEPSHPTRSDSNAVSGGFICSNGRKRLTGRPGKSNKYHGFCQGAWTSMEDPNKGMEVKGMLTGHYGVVMHILTCSECKFKGVLYRSNDKKSTFTDPHIRIAKCGIRYRFSFLVKSHKKSKDNWNSYNEAPGKIDERMNKENYGCLFCCAEGYETDIYGGVESLMNHIFHEHSRNPTPGIDKLAKCVYGGEAHESETFDIHIPAPPSPAPEQSAATASLDFAWDREEDVDLIDMEPLQPQNAVLLDVAPM